MNLGRTLFLKIFLWFGAALLTVVVGTFLVGELLRPEPFRPPMRRPMDMAVNGYAQVAAEIYERDGQTALANYSDRVEHEGHVRIFLFDNQLRELAGRNRRDELAALATDFDQMAEQIESLVNGQRRLLGDISHELRSPLARLNVALELARQRAGEDAATALQRIEREAETLNEMIGQLLALTRLENHTEAVQRTSFDLAQLIREIVDDADYEAKNCNRLVRLESPELCHVLGNEQLLRRAVENVVRNAVQFTADGTEVEVKLACGDQAVITVRDHGPGVPAEALDKLFRPFYRVDEARDRESGGTGLGLAIAERAVRLHGGTVEAANVVTGGLAVTIILPLKQTADSKQQTAGGRKRS